MRNERDPRSYSKGDIIRVKVSDDWEDDELEYKTFMVIEHTFNRKKLFVNLKDATFNDWLGEGQIMQHISVTMDSEFRCSI